MKNKHKDSSGQNVHATWFYFISNSHHINIIMDFG